AVIEVAPDPVVIAIVLSIALPVVTFSAPVSEPALMLPTRPLTVSAAAPASVSAVFSASAVVLTVTVSLLKLSLIEVAAEPVAMEIVLSDASPVITESVPVSEAALMLPTSPVTISVAEPTSVSAVLLASAEALIVSVSFAPLAVIEVTPDPVVMAILSSVALPVVTFSAPVSEPALRLPTRPVTVSTAVPESVRVVFSASAVALTVTISLVLLELIEVAPDPVVINMPLSFASPAVTLSTPVSEPALRSPTRPVTVSAAEPESVSTVFCANAVALTVTVSLLKLSVIEVAPDPVVIAIVLSVASPVVTESVPVRVAALMLPIRPLTTSAAEPASVSAVLLASVVASTITVSPAPLAVIEVAPDPVVIAIVLSIALPVVTFSAPVSEPALMLPTRPLTVSAAAPASVSAVFSASAVVLTVTVSLLKLSLIEVAAEPVAMEIVLSDASPVVTESVPVSEAALMLPTSPVTISVAEPTSVSAVLLASAEALIVSASFAPLAVIEVTPDPVVMAILSSVALPVVTFSAPVSEPALRLPTRPVTVSTAVPESVRVVFSASAVALTVTISLVLLELIEVAPEPVVMATPLSFASPAVTLSAPVSEAALRSPTRPVTVSAAEPESVSTVFCA